MNRHSGTARLAVDFAILPPDHVMDIAVSLNRKVCDNSFIVLDKERSFPHVSLLMGCLKIAQIEEAESIFKTIGSQQQEMILSVRHIHTVNTATDDIITLDINPHKGLQLLHETLVDAFGPLLLKDAGAADVFGDAPPNTSTLEWINNFIPKSSGKNFWPHITIGYLNKSKALEKFEPFNFTASRIAMCHLGNYCTCARIVSETRLQEQRTN